MYAQQQNLALLQQINEKINVLCHYYHFFQIKYILSNRFPLQMSGERQLAGATIWARN